MVGVMNRVAFLFGSGISRLSGAPGVTEITNALLNRGWRDDGNLRFNPNGIESIGIAQRAQEFLRVLKNYLLGEWRLHKAQNFLSQSLTSGRVGYGSKQDLAS